MRWFLVAMMIYPDVQKRGQAELDSVIGRERLPTFDDRPRLPFVDAVYKEVLRWRPVAPVGVFPQSLPMTRDLEVSEQHHVFVVLTGRCPTCSHKR